MTRQPGFTAPRLRCLKCLEICDVIEVDQGGKEEIWGRMQHVPQMVDVSECCEAEFEVDNSPQEEQ